MTFHTVYLAMQGSRHQRANNASMECGRMEAYAQSAQRTPMETTESTALLLRDALMGQQERRDQAVEAVSQDSNQTDMGTAMHALIPHPAPLVHNVFPCMVAMLRQARALSQAAQNALEVMDCLLEIASLALVTLGAMEQQTALLEKKDACTPKVPLQYV